MGDVHFILRHAMTGAVFVVVFALTYMLLRHQGDLGAVTLPTSFGQNGVGDAVLTAIAFPIIGITIQGMHIWLLDRKGSLFKDLARRVVAEQVRAAIEEAEKNDRAKASGERPLGGVDWHYLKNASDDACFVWLYHSCAGGEMIEWARRRRSYYYLGINWVAAAVLGALAALAVESINHLHPAVSTTLLALLIVAWLTGAIWAALRMRRDADSMEAIWAAAVAHPELRERLASALPTLNRPKGASGTPKA